MTNSPVSWNTLRDDAGTPQTMTTTIPFRGLEPAYAALLRVAEHLNNTDAANYFTATATPGYLYIDLRPNASGPLPDAYAAIADKVASLVNK